MRICFIGALRYVDQSGLDEDTVSGLFSYKFHSVSTFMRIIDQRRPEAREILELGWLQGRRRLNTSNSGEDFRGDILCEEELDN